MSEEFNSSFVDMLEQYYSQPDEIKRQDARPDEAYQVGSTPAYTEVCSFCVYVCVCSCSLSLCLPPSFNVVVENMIGSDMGRMVSSNLT